MTKSQLTKLSTAALRARYIELAAQFQRVCESCEGISLSGSSSLFRRLCTSQTLDLINPTPAEWVEAAQFVVYDVTVHAEIYRNNHG